MARRFQEITEVYRQALSELARGDRWTAFLRSACRNYKLHFEEQILVPVSYTHLRAHET